MVYITTPVIPSCFVAFFSDLYFPFLNFKFFCLSSIYMYLVASVRSIAVIKLACSLTYVPEHLCQSLVLIMGSTVL